MDQTTAPSDDEGGREPWAARLRAAFSLRRNLGALVHEPDGAFASLDGLRAIAALWVLAFHAISIPVLMPATAGALAPYTQRPILRAVFAGHLAVDIFLVLAGFLMAHLLLREQRRRGSIDFMRFVRRRWLRIVPLYAAAIALYMADDPIQRASCARWGWASLLFVNNFFGPQLKPDSCLGHGWSLAVEFQLYLVTPFLVAWCFAARWRLWLALGLVLGACAMVVGWYDAHPTRDWYATALYDKPWGRAAPYFAGMLAAFAVAQPPRRRAIFVLVDALALITLLALVFTPPDWVDRGSILRLPLLLLGRALFGGALSWIIFRMLTGGQRVLDRVLGARAWLPLARLSYAAYLVQFVCVTPLCAWWAPRVAHAQGFARIFAELVAETLVATTLTLLLALIGHLFVEKPFMNLRER